MRVVVVAKFFLAHGAVDRRARQEVAALARAGHDVVVVCERVSDWHPEAEALLRDPDVAARVRLETLAGRLERRWFPRRPVVLSLELGFVLAATARVRSVARDADLVICHSGGEAPMTVFAAAGRRAVTCLVVHTTMSGLDAAGITIYRRSAAAWYRLCEAVGLPRLDATVSVSEAVRAEAVAAGARPGSALVLLNPIDTQMFAPHPDLPCVRDVYVAGRLAPEKGVEVLLEALALLKARGRPVSALVAGDGVWRDKLQEQAARLGLGVEFAGWLESPSLRAELGRSRVAVVPSRYEAQGLVVLEAMACGRPVIASAVGGIPEVLTDGVEGWLVPPDDPEALAQALERVLGDDHARERAGDAGRRKALEHDLVHFESAVVRQYEALVDQLLPTTVGARCPSCRAPRLTSSLSPRRTCTCT